VIYFFFGFELIFLFYIYNYKSDHIIFAILEFMSFSFVTVTLDDPLFQMY
jgi:hypothetical protein